MIIVRIMGGLGNQMYQYALYKKMSLYFENTKIDILHYRDEIKINQIRPFELSLFPDIQYDIANRDEVYSLIGKRGDSFCDKIADRFFPRKSFVYTDLENGLVDETLYAMNKVYLTGYWQNYSYFSDIIGDLKKEFIFPKSKKMENLRMEDYIRQHNCVAVHIRRGDYINGKELYGGICTDQYYYKAISEMKKKLVNPVFIFFSDDQTWTKKNFADVEGALFPVINQDSEQYYDMHLMSICNHNINVI